MQDFAWEVREQVTTFKVKAEFQQDIETLMIPQFFQVIPESIFSDGVLELLEKEQLAEDFTLKGKAYDIDFSAADDEIAEIDVRGKGGWPAQSIQNERGRPAIF